MKLIQKVVPEISINQGNPWNKKYERQLQAVVLPRATSAEQNFVQIN